MDLLARVKVDEPDAWERLVDLYAPLVYRWCRRSDLQADDAADVVQEVFVAVANHIRDFHRDRPDGSFRGWLFTITRNKIHDHFRRLVSRPQAEGGTSAQDRMAQIPEELPDLSDLEDLNAEEVILARRAMELVRAEVEDRTWQAFWRIAVQGEEAAAVAADLRMSVRAAYEAKYRVRRRIRRELADFDAVAPQVSHVQEPGLR